MSKTIKQIAAELGVSKQAVVYRLKKLEATTGHGILAVKENGVLVVSLAAETLIKSAFTENDHQKESPKEAPKNRTTDSDLLAVLQQTIDTLQRQLDTKDRQIEALQSALNDERLHSKEQADKMAVLADTAQRLHAGTIKQLGEGGGISEEKTSWWRRCFRTGQ